MAKLNPERRQVQLLFTDTSKREYKVTAKTITEAEEVFDLIYNTCLLYTSPSPRDRTRSRMPSSA